MEDRSFRSKAAFGKRIEYYIIARMLKEGLDVYIPMVDDNAIDAVVKRKDGIFVEIQIKAISKNSKDPTLFAAISHVHRKNYWFIFYSEKNDNMWILSSKEFIDNSYENKNGKNIGKRTINLTKKFSNYKAYNFQRIEGEDPK